MATWNRKKPPSSHSHRVRLDDGRVWRRHVDDVLQNSPGTKKAESGPPSSETATLANPDPQPANPTDANSHQPDQSAPLDATLASTDSVPRRSSRTSKPPQRLIEEKLYIYIYIDLDRDIDVVINKIIKTKER